MCFLNSQSFQSIIKTIPSTNYNDLHKPSFTAAPPVEWTSSLSKVVDPYARHKYHTTVRDSMHMPRPPKYSPDKQGPGRDLWEVLGTPLSEPEKLALSRMDYR